MEDRISDLERAKDILLDAKVNLQNEVSDSGKRQLLLQEQIDALNSQLNDRQKQHETEVKGLKQQIVSHILNYFKQKGSSEVKLTVLSKFSNIFFKTPNLPL